VWDVASGQARQTLHGHRANINAIGFSPDGRRLVTAGEDGVANVWNPDTGVLEAAFSGSGQALADATFSADGRRLATAGFDARVRVWRLDAPRPLTLLAGVPPMVAGAFSPDGKRVAVAGKTGPIVVWDAATGEPVTMLPGPDGGVRALAFAPDGSRVAAGATDSVWMWETTGWTPLFHAAGHKGAVRAVAFDPGGARLLSVGADATARLWDAHTGAAIRTLGPLRGEGWTGVFTAGGARVVTTSEAYEADLWDAASGAHVATLPFQGARVEALAASPDGAWFAVGAAVPPPIVFRAGDGGVVTQLVGHAGLAITDLDASPDGAAVLSTGEDGTARLWSASTGAQLAQLDVATAPVVAGRFGPGGARVATASLDGAVRVWDVPSGRLLAAAPRRGMPRAVRWSPDGNQLLILPYDAPPALWRVDVYAGDAAGLEQVRRCVAPFVVRDGALTPTAPEPEACPAR
jgi:WD40 repeat protein